MAVIRSKLWHAAQLRHGSTYFPTLVRAACAEVGLEYSEAFHDEAAANSTIRALFPLDEDETIDAAIIRAMTDETTASELDNAFLWLATEYKKQEAE